MFRKFQILNHLPNRYFPKIGVGCPRSLSLDLRLTGTVANCARFVYQFSVFTVTPLKIKTKPLNTESPESRKRKKINIQNTSPKIGPVRYFMCDIFEKMFYPNLQSSVWRCHLRGTNVATRNQPTHSSLEELIKLEIQASLYRKTKSPFEPINCTQLFRERLSEKCTRQSRKVFKNIRPLLQLKPKDRRNYLRLLGQS